MNDILNKIIAECPKAWGEFTESVKEYDDHVFKNATTMQGEIGIIYKYIHHSLPRDYATSYNFRNWYDYFDGLGIDIEVHFSFSNNVFKGFIASIFSNLESVILNETAESRVEKEWNAFHEAFKIREGQL